MDDDRRNSFMVRLYDDFMGLAAKRLELESIKLNSDLKN